MLRELPEAALDGDIAVLGRKGGGKTFTAKGIVERLLDMKRRVLILDPLGVWAGLRTAANGDDPGYKIAIFGGQYGDEPLDPALAVPLAQIIAGENLPTIIDLSELTKTAQGTFLYRFLHELRRVNREALTIVLEEADVFAPQNPMGDDSKLLHGEIDWISRRGRFRGFRLISITQRPARLSKDVLTQCSTLIAHKLPAPQDRDAVKAWVEGNGDRDLAKQVFDTLAGLDVGEGWVWSPEHDILQRMKFPRIKTLDTSATPKAGETRIEPKTLAQVDMSGIRKALTEAKAAKDAEDGRSSKPAKNITQNITVPDPKALDDAARSGYERGAADAAANAEVAFKAMHRMALRELLKMLDAQVDAGDEAAFAVEPRPARRDVPQPAAVPSTRQIKPRAPADPDTMPPSASKIIAAIDRTGAPGLTWTQIALLTGYSESGGQYRRGKKWLLDMGAVRQDPDGVRVSKPSRNAAAMPTGDDLVAMWRQRLPPSGRATLDNFWSNRRARAGAPVSIDIVASELNYAPSGGQWRRGLKALRDARITRDSGGTIAFTEEFLKIAGSAP